MVSRFVAQQFVEEQESLESSSDVELEQDGVHQSDDEEERVSWRVTDDEEQLSKTVTPRFVLRQDGISRVEIQSRQKRRKIATMFPPSEDIEDEESFSIPKDDYSLQTRRERRSANHIEIDIDDDPVDSQDYDMQVGPTNPRSPRDKPYEQIESFDMPSSWRPYTSTSDTIMSQYFLTQPNPGVKPRKDFDGAESSTPSLHARSSASPTNLSSEPDLDLMADETLGERPRFIQRSIQTGIEVSDKRKQRASVSATSLSRLIQGRQGISALTDDPLYLNISPPSHFSSRAKQSSQLILQKSKDSSSLSKIVISRILKLQSDVQLNSATDTNDTDCSNRRKISFWKVMQENSGYAHGVKSHAGFTLARIRKMIDINSSQGSETEETWALLFNTASAFAFLQEETEKKTSESLMSIMLKNKSLQKNSVLKLYDPVWHISLMKEDNEQLRSAGYDNGEETKGVMVCIKWQLLG
ncbi:uncharacterized protein V2V93DRAFT_365906 [Kockiozyma suomiensis]|uniref:uncharacterized protein n=1 Tax=Kockiozyma suomiensis TaxID=1337062 RepID=UPI003343D9FA